MSGARHWWVRVDLAGSFDHARNVDLAEDLWGYLSELVVFEREGRWSTALLLSMPRCTRDEAGRDALLLVDAPWLLPVLSAEVVTLGAWRASRRDAVTSLSMPGTFGPSPDALTREDRAERDDARRLQTIVSRYGSGDTLSDGLQPGGEPRAP